MKRRYIKPEVTTSLVDAESVMLAASIVVEKTYYYDEEDDDLEDL